MFYYISCKRDLINAINIPSVTSKVSRNRSSSLTKANASSTSNPRQNARKKSAAFCNEPISVVSAQVFISNIYIIKQLL
jgi:hypothetical protein